VQKELWIFAAIVQLLRSLCGTCTAHVCCYGRDLVPVVAKIARGRALRLALMVLLGFYFFFITGRMWKISQETCFGAIQRGR